MSRVEDYESGSSAQRIGLSKNRFSCCMSRLSENLNLRLCGTPLDGVDGICFFC